MKVAVLYSKQVPNLDIEKYLPHDCDGIVIGGAGGYDSRVSDYAIDKGKKLILELPVNDKCNVEGVISDAESVISFVKKHDEVVESLCKKLNKAYTEIII